MLPRTTPTPFCLRYLRRSLHEAEPVQRVAFSTTPALCANPQKKKGAVAKPNHRQGHTLKINKKGRRDGSSGRPPAPGERKAFRKRVVLSNTNALEVSDLQEFSQATSDAEHLSSIQGHMLAFANDTVDVLRALEGFKATQGWSQFRRPATLVRRDTVELARQLDMASAGETRREILYGPRAGGKSVLQLQGLAMAFLRGFVVIHFPEAKDLTNAHTSFLPVKTSGPKRYCQPHYTAQLLANVAKANYGILSALRLSQRHDLPIPIQPNISLQRFAEIGASDPEVAWPVWEALWAELTAQSQASGDGLQRPPLYVSMDGVDHAMRNSAYLDTDMKPVHAHDLTLIQQFVSLLSGVSSLPNGGLINASVSESNRAASETLDKCIARNSAFRERDQARDKHSGTGVQATGKVSNPPLPPTMDPYVAWDERVIQAIPESGLFTRRVGGLSKEEARGIMEYYAKSGVMRAPVTPGLVGEKWSLAGGGIVGELEKAAVLLRF